MTIGTSRNNNLAFWRGFDKSQFTELLKLKSNGNSPGHISNNSNALLIPGGINVN